MSISPYKNVKAIVIGGSAGSFSGITAILRELPENYGFPIIMAMHRLKHVRHGFQEALSVKTKINILEPEDKIQIKKGNVYLAPANYHLCVELGNSISLSTEPMINNSRPAIDLTFETAAYNYKNGLVGILLSGANKDGAMGMKKVKDKGGITIIQDPATCVIDTMPKAAMKLTKIDYILSIEEITKFLLDLDQGNK